MRHMVVESGVCHLEAAERQAQRSCFQAAVLLFDWRRTVLHLTHASGGSARQVQGTSHHYLDSN